MRSLLAFAASSPLLLLAACGDSTPAGDVEAEEMDTASLNSEAEAEGSTEMPGVPQKALDTVAYSGAYTIDGPDGTSRLALNAEDNTYEYTAPDGTKRTGSYEAMSDRQRIRIQDYDGRAGYFAIGDGVLYRLPEETSTVDEITVTGMYRREGNNVIIEGGPKAATATTADKRS